jgi:hypothetical protein
MAAVTEALSRASQLAFQIGLDPLLDRAGTGNDHLAHAGLFKGFGIDKPSFVGTAIFTLFSPVQLYKYLPAGSPA